MMRQRASEALADLVDRTRGVPTFAAVVMVDGEVVLEHKATHRLCACSTFKVAAATAVMSLVREGAIDLDRPVLSYDGSLAFSDAGLARDVTLRHLLSHTSGLDDTDEAEPHPRQCLQHLGFLAEPGRAFRYSNVAFDVGVLTAASWVGLGYENLLRQRVLTPLAMHDTHWRPGIPMGAPFTTARDLMRLAEEHLGGNRVLRPRHLEDMHRIHADSFTASPGRYYGLGIGVEHWAARTLLSHGGGLHRYGSAFLIDQAERAAAVLLFDDPAGYAIAPHDLLDRILDRATRPPLPKPGAVDFAPYLGRYSNGAELVASAGGLRVRWKGEEHALNPVDERLFASKRGVSVGLLGGTPTMISVNDFILIGALPGVLLEQC
jgi:CubicO group peptidase (beta-lactamase class C family)